MGSFISTLLLVPIVTIVSSILAFGGLAGGEPEEQVPLTELLESLQELVEQEDEEEDEVADQQQQQQHDLLWRRIRHRLKQVPEEAACYCHTVDPSPLLQCLTNTPLSIHIPLEVIQSFVEAYEDAVYNTDGPTGTTPLMAAIQRAGILKKKKKKLTTTPNQQEDIDATTTTSEEEDKIIELLLDTNPFAAKQTDKRGRLPLHFLRSTSLPTARKVLDASSPSALQQQDHRGRIPLHYYCQLFVDEQQQESETQNDDSRIEQPLALTIPNVDIAKLFLSTNTTPLAAAPTSPVSVKENTKNGGGKTPLDLFFKSYETILQQQQHKGSSSTSRRGQQQQGTDAVTTRVVDQLWEILTLLVHSATATGKTTTLNPPIVHSLVSLRCPSTIVREALRRFPHQAVERDDQGHTPLLLAVGLLEDSAASAAAAAAAATTKTHNHNSHHHHHHNDNDDTRTTKSCGGCTNTQQVIAILLETNQRAARMADKEGRLAIDVLSEKQYYNHELYDLLVRAEPRALCTRDLKNKQHPFLTAAMAGNSNGVYHLLRAKPHVIRYFLNEC